MTRLVYSIFKKLEYQIITKVWAEECSMKELVPVRR